MEGIPVTTIIVLISAFSGILIGSLAISKKHLLIPTRLLGALMILMGLFLIFTVNTHDALMVAHLAQEGAAVVLIALSVGVALILRFFYAGSRISVIPQPRSIKTVEKKDRYIIKPQVRNEYLEKISNYLEVEQRFLDKDLTLTKLTEELHLSSSYTSRIINEAYGKNFKEFVNEYRIEMACKKLLSDSLKNYTIEGIAQESGFHSRTAFYNAFKKSIGMSPGEYIAKYQMAQMVLQ